MRQQALEKSTARAIVSVMSWRIISILVLGVALVVTGCGRPAAGISSAAALKEGRIGPIVFATGVANRKPVGAASRFPAGTRRIYAFFDFEWLKPDDTLDTLWYAEGQEIFKRSDTVSKILQGSTVGPTGSLWFYIGWGEGAPPGSYRFVVRINGREARSGIFTVDSK